MSQWSWLCELNIEKKVDSVSLPGYTLLVGEYEELYGPGKEPVIQQLSDLVPVENSAL